MTNLEIMKKFLDAQKKKVFRYTKISVLVAAAMMALSLVLLWIKLYQLWLILLSLAGFSVAILMIAILFLVLFDDGKKTNPKSVKSD